MLGLPASFHRPHPSRPVSAWSFRRFGSPPERPERVCETLGLRAMRRIEMVPVLEDFEFEISEEGVEPLRDLPELGGVAQRAQSVVDGAPELPQCLAIEVVARERLH